MGQLQTWPSKWRNAFEGHFRSRTHVRVASNQTISHEIDIRTIPFNTQPKWIHQISNECDAWPDHFACQTWLNQPTKMFKQLLLIANQNCDGSISIHKQRRRANSSFRSPCNNLISLCLMSWCAFLSFSVYLYPLLHHSLFCLTVIWTYLHKIAQLLALTQRLNIDYKHSIWTLEVRPHEKKWKIEKLHVVCCRFVFSWFS